jgi:hypothetical protein
MSKVSHLVRSSLDSSQRSTERAAALRILALDCHAVAESFSTAATRAQMHQIAESYDRKARDCDRIAKSQAMVARA